LNIKREEIKISVKIGFSPLFKTIKTEIC